MNFIIFLLFYYLIICYNKTIEELKEYFEYYKEREVYTQKYLYCTENVDGYWISFPIIKGGHRVYFCPVLISTWSNEVYKRLDELQRNFLTRINMIPELKDKFVIK